MIGSCAVSERKNVLFVCADQLGAKWLGCYGSGVASTPTLDALAADGVRFDRCYATIPVCAPNRATMLSGRSACVHGVVANNYFYPSGLPTYADILRKAGYRTGGFGKFHQSPMHLPAPSDVANLGFDESMVTEDPKWPWYEWVKETHPEHARAALSMAWPFWPNYPHHPEAQAAEEPRRSLMQARKDESGWRMVGSSPLPSEVHDTTWITSTSIDFIERHAKEHTGTPFMCHVSYVDPHDPYDPPGDYAGTFDPADMPPALAAEWIENANPVLMQAQKFAGFEEIWQKPEVIAKLRATYHDSLKYMDDQIARLVDTLHANDLLDNTIIVFTTDHGEMLGDHGLMTKGVKHYDAGIRCPLIVAGGGVKGGMISDDLRCTLDLFPTFCDWAGVAPEDRPPLEGRSFAPVVAGGDESEPWPAVSVAYGRARSVLTRDRWRLTRFVDENTGQMFNLAEDPDEQRDLYGDPSATEQKVRLLERLHELDTMAMEGPHPRNMPEIDGQKRVLGG